MQKKMEHLVCPTYDIKTGRQGKRTKGTLHLVTITISHITGVLCIPTRKTQSLLYLTLQAVSRRRGENKCFHRDLRWESREEKGKKEKLRGKKRENCTTVLDSILN